MNTRHRYIPFYFSHIAGDEFVPDISLTVTKAPPLLISGKMDSSHSEYVVIPGSISFSRPRSRALAESIGAKDIRAQWVHYANVDENLQEHELSILKQLLSYGDITDELASFDPQDGPSATYYISPRVGTISPWSSQATGIAQVCGLKNVVKRIERGLRISCLFAGSQEGVEEKYLDVLHDRMTQLISTSEPDLSIMFSERPPLPLEIISLQNGEKSPMDILQEANKRLGLPWISRNWNILSTHMPRKAQWEGHPPTSSCLCLHK